MQIVIDPAGGLPSISVFPEPGSVAIVETDFEALRDKCAALRMSAAQARALATALVAAAEESERLQELFCRDSGADESGASSEFL